MFEALNSDMPCEEPFKIERSDAAKTVETIQLKVQRGSCPPAQCKEDELQNLDLVSTTACACEPLPTPKGELIDFRTEKKREFAYDFGAKVTLRVFMEADGQWMWKLPNEEPDFMTALAMQLPCWKIDPQDPNMMDTRYVQLELTAVMGNCKSEIEFSLRDPDAGDEKLNLVVAVWPEKGPEYP